MRMSLQQLNDHPNKANASIPRRSRQRGRNGARRFEPERLSRLECRRQQFPFNIRRRRDPTTEATEPRPSQCTLRQVNEAVADISVYFDAMVNVHLNGRRTQRCDARREVIGRTCVKEHDLKAGGFADLLRNAIRGSDQVAVAGPAAKTFDSIPRSFKLSTNNVMYPLTEPTTCPIWRTELMPSIVEDRRQYFH